MATTRFAENLYSFRMTKPIFGTVPEPFDPVSAALAAIEAKLAEADTLFLARKYREAVPVYREAEALVFKQLHPPAPSVITEAPRDPELFTPLLSMAVEWMNILSVNEPIGAARPRERVDPALLGKAAKLDGLGLRSNVLASGDNADALADFQMSRALAGQGNDKASAFFLDRARQLGPELVAALERDGDPATPTKPALPPAVTAERHLGVLVGEELASFDWPLGEGPPIKHRRRRVVDLPLQRRRGAHLQVRRGRLPLRRGRRPSNLPNLGRDGDVHLR
jgi:hypothetical protein